MEQGVTRGKINAKKSWLETGGGYDIASRWMSGNTEPAISFIIPAFNEEAEIGITLASIHAAARAAGCNYEIVVADDASTDQTAAMARACHARVVPIRRRQIAAARNAGAAHATGAIFIFIDADTRITAAHVVQARRAIGAGFAGGAARLRFEREIPLWSRILFRLFSAVYFGLNLGAGAFLFTTRQNFLAIGGFDESYFAGEEIFFTIALRKLGRFTILRQPVITSGRKLRLYSGATILRRVLVILFRGKRAVMSRAGLDLWYGGAREEPGA